MQRTCRQNAIQNNIPGTVCAKHSQLARFGIIWSIVGLVIAIIFIVIGFEERNQLVCFSSFIFFVFISLGLIMAMSEWKRAKKNFVPEPGFIAIR